MKAESRMIPAVAEELREAIRDAGGNEVCAVGRCDEEGAVVELVVSSRGHESAVPVVRTYAERGDVLIHNHPGGKIEPSDADLAVAGRFAEEGLGFFIVDNGVERLYAVVEPVPNRDVRLLEADELERLFEPGGVFSRVFPDYEPREQQIRMMREVAEGMNRGGVVVVEAGTGVGKSVAYLLPVFYWAELNEERVVISTATINLQQQLVDKDIPLVARITGLNVQAALVKGRRNYLCLRRFAESEQEVSLFDEEHEHLSVIREWAGTTNSGARNDLPVYVPDSVWSRVCAESDSCRGLRCAFRSECFVYRARKQAAAARILVANHHLLFSDLAIRRQGIGRESTAVLPPFRHIVFDEAHNIERNATSFFSEGFSRAALNRSLSRLHRTTAKSTGGALHRIERFLPEDRKALVERCVETLIEARRVVEELNEVVVGSMTDRTVRLRDRGIGAIVADGHERLSDLLVSVRRLSAQVSEVVSSVPEAYRDEDPLFDVSVAIRRLDAFTALLDQILHIPEHPDRVFWIEHRGGGRAGPQATFHVTPLDVREIMRESVFETYDTVVCTSATLTVRDRFDFFAGRVGLSGFEDRVSFVQLDSPFSYRERVLLTVATDAPEPKDPSYQSYVEETVGRILETSEGRALVLFTSYRMLEETHAAVSPGLADMGITALKQNSDDRSRLLGRFGAEPTSVLFATDSFWEGVDTPGDALRVVIMCKLPFRVPNDPVLEARIEAIEQAGGNPFYELSVPQAVMRLRQGFGRLMRRATDGGVVVVLDPRMVTRRYGTMFVESLPETGRAFTGRDRMIDEIERFLYAP